MARHIMVDLETLGTGPNAAVLSIGMVMFDDSKPFPLSPEGIHQKIRQNTVSGDVDIDTVMWWMQQSDDARRKMVDDSGEFPEIVVVTDVARFLKSYDDVLLWGNGASFDNVILRSLFARNEVKWPLKYTSDRCYRTMRAMFPQVPVQEFVGTKHHAYDDAMHQAKHLYAILQHLK